MARRSGFAARVLERILNPAPVPPDLSPPMLRGLRDLLIGSRRTAPRVLGVGTGRCGTMSLAQLLDAQKGLHVTHERFSWRVPWDARAVGWPAELLEEGGGDVGFYWLPHLPYIWKHAPKTQVLCMRRDRTSTIESYHRKTEGRNHWMNHSGQRWNLDRWDCCYPKYGVTSKKEALGRYWDEYYRRAKELQNMHPERFRIFDLEALNEEAGQHAILTFVGIPRSDHVLNVGIRANPGDDSTSGLLRHRWPGTS